MESIAIDGAELSSMTLGQGPAVVMLHGLATGNMASWFSAIASPLSARYKIVLYDQRGHGGSGSTTSGFDLDTQAEDLQAVLAYHGLNHEPVDLVGHSMGALIALHYALSRPDRIRRLVLVDAPMPAREYIAPSLLGARSREELSYWMEHELAVSAGLRGRRRQRLQQRLETLLFETTLRQDVLAMDSEPDTALSKLNMPVLLVYGRSSPCLAVGEHLRCVLPQARLETLDCGHYIPEEAPAALCALLDEYLSLPLNDMTLPLKLEPSGSMQTIGVA